MAAPMEWLQLTSWPKFEVSECGDVREIATRKRLRGFIDADGYLRYALKGAAERKGAVAAHVLVATHFIGPAPSERHEVAHENGSRIHNHHTNLRWKLPAENQADRVAHGTSAAGERNPHAKITEADVADIRIEYRRIKQPGSGRTVAELDARYGLKRSTIIRIAKGQSWPHVPMPNFLQMEL